MSFFFFFLLPPLLLLLSSEIIISLFYQHERTRRLRFLATMYESIQIAVPSSAELFWLFSHLTSRRQDRLQKPVPYMYVLVIMIKP